MEQDKGDAKFTPKELTLIDLLADPTDARTKDEKCEAVGFHRKQVYWLQKNRDGFNNAVYERLTRYVKSNLPKTYAQLFGIADRARSTKDRLKAIEIIFKATGDILPANVSQQTTVLSSSEAGIGEKQLVFGDRLAEQIRKRTDYIESLQQREDNNKEGDGE